MDPAVDVAGAFLPAMGHGGLPAVVAGLAHGPKFSIELLLTLQDLGGVRSREGGHCGVGKVYSQGCKLVQEEHPVVGPASWGEGACAGVPQEGLEVVECLELAPEAAGDARVVGWAAGRGTLDPASGKVHQVMESSPQCLGKGIHFVGHGWGQCCGCLGRGNPLLQ